MAPTKEWKTNWVRSTKVLEGKSDITLRLVCMPGECQLLALHGEPSQLIWSQLTSYSITTCSLCLPAPDVAYEPFPPSTVSGSVWVSLCLTAGPSGCLPRPSAPYP